MYQQPIEIEDLLRFIDQLRRAGFDISTQQFAAAQNVLIALAVHGSWPDELRALRTWLAPVICSSPQEQENFYRRFDHWIEQRAKRDPRPGPGPTPGPGPVNPEKAKSLPKIVLIAGTALAIVLGVILLLPRIPRTLAGQVVDQDTRQPVAAANVLFAGKNSLTDQNGTFNFSYRETELPQSLTVTRKNYESRTQQVVAGSTSGLVVSLQSLPTPTPIPTPSSGPSERPTPDPTPASSELRRSNPVHAVPIPTVPPPTPPNDNSYWRWTGFGSAALPLIAFALWSLWQKKLRSALLEKLRTAARPRLEQIVVKGAAGQLFMGQSFRRTIQDLRRHRQKGASELHVERTVDATIKRGGLFSPRYGNRQTLPEYLVLIDRAGFEDQQARLYEEIVRRLAQNNVFVDAYFFHGDPRVCRKHESSWQYVTLQDLAALHRDHHLIIFTDGSSFLNPLTGTAEHWIEMFSPWSKRAILTPEPPAYWGHREWMLAQADFVILPATAEGLAALSELVDVDSAPAVDIDPQARPYPALLADHEQRWLEDRDLPAADVERLCDQLKLYLGAKGYFWLSACAVYPILHWDLTLYFGFKLSIDRSSIEERLMSLVRLPWFRYGTMPEWLRLRLISEMSPQEEQTVRRVLEELFLTVLERPADGINIQFASEKSTPASRLQKFRGKLERWKFRRLFWRFVKDERSESPLRDYVFVSFMAGRKPRKLAVSLPQVIRRLFFPQGQIALGLRTASGLALSVICSLAFVLATWILTPSVDAGPSGSQYYLQMTSQEQMEFIREKTTQISQTLDDRTPELNDNEIKSIKTFVDYYAYRVGNKSSEPWLEDLTVVFGRATQVYAPTIITEFEKRSVSPLLGLYIPMSYTEFIDYLPYGNNGTFGVFQLTSRQAQRYGLSPQDRHKIGRAAPVAADALVDMGNMMGPDLRFPSVLILSYKRGPNQIKSDTDQFYPEIGVYFQPTGWDFQANASRLGAKFQNEDSNAVPKFFAAAIVGENPRSFGLDMNALSTYSTIVEPTPIEREVADLIAKFSGDERREASDQLVQLYAANKSAVVAGLVNSILSNGPNRYRVNLYIARTLGSIPQPGWDGSVEQFNSVRALKSTPEYADETFKDWVDKAVGNFNVKNFIDCDCASLQSSSYQRECSAVESQLIEHFKTTGNITGWCDPRAQGPNAKPREQTATAGTTPSPSPTPSPFPPDLVVSLTADRTTAKVGETITFTAQMVTPRGALPPQMYHQFVFGDSGGRMQLGPRASYSYSRPGTYKAFVNLRETGGAEKVRSSSDDIIIVITEDSDVEISDVVGATETEARQKLAASGFKIGNVTYIESEKSPPGTVVQQDPTGLTLAKKGSAVNLVVAKSQSLVHVPGVIGKTVREAENLIQSLGLVPSVDYGRNFPAPDLVIVSQTPPADTKVTTGTWVKMTACKNRDCQ